MSTTTQTAETVPHTRPRTGTRTLPQLHTIGDPVSAAVAIRPMRDLADLTVEQVAREASVSAAHLSRVEAGKVEASPKWLGLVSGVIAKHLAADVAVAR